MLENIEWPKITMADDYCISAQTFAKAQKFMTIEEPLYYYVKNYESVSYKSYTNKLQRDNSIQGTNFVADFTEKHFPEFLPEALWRKMKCFQNIFIHHVFSNEDNHQEIFKSLKQEMRKNYDKMRSELKKQNRTLKEHAEFGDAAERYNFKSWMRHWLFAHCPSLAMFYLKIRLKLHALTGI